MEMTIGKKVAEGVLALSLCVAITGNAGPVAYAQPPQSPTADKPYVVDYYYKTRWGYADEFIRLFKKNHFPVLKKEMELGRILRVTAASPRFHATEEGRWDYRVTITWKNVGVTDDGFDAAGITKALYPDQETFKREEQRRFEILVAHWDTPMTDVDLSK
jgi:hypothetical protein